MKQPFGARRHLGWNKRNEPSFSKSIFMLLILSIIFPFLFSLLRQVSLGSQTVLNDISISARPASKGGEWHPQEIREWEPFEKETRFGNDGRGPPSPETFAALPGRSCALRWLPCRLVVPCHTSHELSPVVSALSRTSEGPTCLPRNRPFASWAIQSGNHGGYRKLMNLTAFCWLKYLLN